MNAYSCTDSLSLGVPTTWLSGVVAFNFNSFGTAFAWVAQFCFLGPRDRYKDEGNFVNHNDLIMISFQ